MKALHIEKPKPPPGRSYPLKSSMLDPLVESLPEEFEASLSYVVWKETPRRVVLEGRYLMPNDRVPHRRLYMSAGDFPSVNRKELAVFLMEEAVPALCRWVQYVNSLPDNATALVDKPFFQAYVENDETFVSSRPTLP